MPGYLIAEEGPIAGFVARLEEGEEWTLGRDPDEVSIVLSDPMVSRKHAICRASSEGFTLESLSAVNPVTQNGKIITDSVLLQEGDIIQIGSTFFRFSEISPDKDSLPPENIDAKAPLHFEELEDLFSVNVDHIEEARWFLKVISGPNTGAEFGMQKASTYILGKDPSLCDIVFQDLSVSRQHARLSVDEQNQIFIEDLNSRNGVLVNGQSALEKIPLSSQDLIALGTTSFLMIDKELAHQTIFSPASVPLHREEEILTPAEIESAASTALPDWKETVFPYKHLIIAGLFATLLVLGLMATIALFKTEELPPPPKNESELVTDALREFSDIQFSFNPANGKLFLVGHVLSPVDKQELLYKVKNLSFVLQVEDNVVVDEYVWQNMNAILISYPEWQGVSIFSPAPGKFVLRGYLQTLDQAQALTEYLNIHFPYLDRLDNQIVVESNLETQIQSTLVEKGFSGVTFQLSNGELLLTGRVDHHQSQAFLDFVERCKTLPGIRLIKNFVIFTTADTSRIDLSDKYQITGFSRKNDTNFFVVINGKILGIGDYIDGMTITQILPDIVLLEKDGLKFRINYNLQ